MARQSIQLVGVMLAVLCCGCFRENVWEGDAESDSGTSTVETGSGTDSESSTTGDSGSATGATETDSGAGNQADSSTVTVRDSDSEGDSQTTGDSGTGADTGSDSTQEWGTETDDVETESESDTAPDTNTECEGVDFQTDAENCGGCNKDCLTNDELWPDYGDVVPENIRSATCNAGHCQVAECDSGFKDDPIFPYPDCELYIKQVTSGGTHTCTLFSNNTVKCWGGNTFGQLGRNLVGEDFTSTPGLVTGLSIAPGESIVAISSGRYHNCVLISDNTVQCWGNNGNFQLGRDTGEDSFSRIPAEVDGLDLPAEVNIVSLTTGFYISCAVLSNSTIQCWGDSVDGMLGRDGSTYTPGYVEGLPPADNGTIVQAATGYGHSCILLSDGTVECWGLNSRGQLNRDSLYATWELTTVNGISPESFDIGDFTLAVGGSHNCVLFSNNTVQCWGSNTSGQLGWDTVEDQSYEPGGVVGLALDAGVSIVSLSIEASHSCALLSDGSAQCWGRNNEGQLGRNTGDEWTHLPPGKVTGLDGVRIMNLSLGNQYTCAVVTDGTVWCWGDNKKGQLGWDTGTDDYSSVPTLVQNLF